MYLSSGHGLQQVVSVSPPHHGYEEHGGDSCQVAAVEEGERNAQESCPQAEVHHKEEPHEDIHGLSLLLPAIAIPPKAHLELQGAG